MSTKIYHAYHYAGGVDELLRWLLAFRKRHVKHTLAKMEAIIKPDAPFHEIAAILREATKQGINSDLNLTASAVVYLVDAMVLVQFFGVDDALLRHLSPKFADFHYQNSTDRPSKIPEKEWRRRRRTWDKVMRNGVTFAECGLSFQLTPLGFEYEIARHCCTGT